MQVQSNTKVTVNLSLFLFHSSLSFSLSVVCIIFYPVLSFCYILHLFLRSPFSSPPFYSRSRFVGESIEIDLLTLFPGAKHDAFSTLISLPLHVAFETSVLQHISINSTTYYIFFKLLITLYLNKLLLKNNSIVKE